MGAMEKGFESKNFYELLGVPQTATEKEIKLAYREIALVYHPDSHFFDEIIGESERTNYSKIFTRVTEAYHTLTNPVMRAKYDETLPPELPDWGDDDDEEFDSIDEKTQEFILSDDITRPKTFGSFGYVECDDCEEETPPEKGGVFGFVRNLFK